MKVSTVIAVLLSCTISVSAIAQTRKPDLAKAKETYDQMCAGCHGFKGDGGEGHRGGFSPHIGTLALKDYMASVPDEYLVMIIKKGGAYMGKMSTMPAWEKKFSEEEILDLVVHIRTFIKQDGGATAH